MDGYQIKEVGGDFVIFAGDLSVLRCQTERDAKVAVSSALDLFENPNNWWRALQERLAISEPPKTAEEAMPGQYLVGAGAPPSREGPNIRPVGRQPEVSSTRVLHL